MMKLLSWILRLFSHSGGGVVSTLVLDEVRPSVELVLVVGHVGLPGDGRGPAVRQGAAHRQVLGLLRRAVHAVELRSTWWQDRATAEGSRESAPVSGIEFLS